MAEKTPSYTGRPKKSPGKTILKIALILLATIILLVIVDKLFIPSENRNSDNTYGSSDRGLKAIYLSAKQYLEEKTDAKVERYTKIARFLPKDSIAVCTVTEYYGFSVSEIEELFNYIENGGIFTFITDESLYIVINDILRNAGNKIFDTQDTGKKNKALSAQAQTLEEYDPEEAPYEGLIDPEMIGKIGLIGNIEFDDEDGLWVTIEYGKGMMIFSETVSTLRNESMKSDKHYGAKLLVKLEQICKERNIKKVLFDEYYAGIQSDPVPDILGYGFVICLIELGLAAVIYFVSTAQRFGAPVKVGAEEKRNETEHIDAMAKLYRRTGSGAIGFKIHMEALAEDIGRSLGIPEGTAYSEILETALETETFKGSGLDELSAVYKNADNIRFPDKLLEKYIQKMDQIRKERLQ